ncbi:DNA-binding NarL/FixJ family response regulator [Mobiluncus mulieris]|uniref:response regulator transcription factor n=1 Tax=Mobiluncus mulieris TaxID=2052 RepID=UPI0017BCC41C|nr:LuxR C-terminal-related transcriptional regulator [Mobiluncus mulieris]MBB5845933.1 DNA-binding NarL/FixJ family response regulator [Mobiluncus mulieris]
MTQNHQPKTPPPAQTPQKTRHMLQICATQERQVWQEALKGKSNAQIAKVMQSKESTIKTHMSAIMQKFSVRSRAELLVFSAKNGAIRE